MPEATELSEMDIGEPRRVIEIEPLVLPVPELLPVPEPAVPEPVGVPEPARTRAGP